MPFFQSALYFALCIFLGDAVPFVVQLFTLAQSKEHFHTAAAEIYLKRYQREALPHNLAFKLTDFPSVQKQLFGPERIPVKNITLFIRADMHSFNPYLVLTYLCPAFLQVYSALSDAFNLSSEKSDAAFKFFLNKIIMKSFAVLGDCFNSLLMRHFHILPGKSITRTDSLFNRVFVCYNHAKGVMDLKDLHEIAANARNAFYQISVSASDKRNAVLESLARLLEENKENIFAANEADRRAAADEKLSSPLLHRLTFGEDKLHQVVSGLHALIELPDPISRTLSATEITEGLKLYRVSCPIGVIGVIFESRPDALIQISSLCIKSGNAVLLKGGREALQTNQVLCSMVRRALEENGFSPDTAQLLETREDVAQMLKEDTLIDLIIPRGSNSFVRYIMDNSRIPVLGHSDGICHVYVDRDADPDTACRIVTDSKTQYVSVCNACETLLVHKDIAARFLPEVCRSLRKKNVEIRGDVETRKLIDCIPATENDWSAEYLDYIISVKIVSSAEEAIAHINRYGSHHTDCIVSENPDTASVFMNTVDSAGVYWNVSTRFADGFVYGLGAEVGIATGKLHARGPMGLEGLTTYKYKLIGSGQTMEDMKSGKRHYTHIPLNEKCPL